MPDGCSELRKHTWSANDGLCSVDLPFDECTAVYVCSSFSATYKSSDVFLCICFCIPGQVSCIYDVCIPIQVGCSFDVCIPSQVIKSFDTAFYVCICISGQVFSEFICYSYGNGDCQTELSIFHFYT
jgi:hypothetical protein